MFGRVWKWPWEAGDHWNEVTVKAGLTVSNYNVYNRAFDTVVGLFMIILMKIKVTCPVINTCSSDFHFICTIKLSVNLLLTNLLIQIYYWLKRCKVWNFISCLFFANFNDKIRKDKRKYSLHLALLMEDKRLEQNTQK